MSVYLTGDTHGDVTRLIQYKWGKNPLSKEKDVIFVLGDFGVIFDNIPTPKEKRLLSLMGKCDCTFMIIDGNHENHPRLYNLPETSIYGGKVGIIGGNNIFHCRRGEVYTIENKKFFTFGGATSIDRSLRVPGVSWWKEEVPSHAEMEYGLKTLEDHQYKVDYILAHTSPEDMAIELIKLLKSFYNDPDPTRKYLEHICKITSFEKFYCGHWHVENTIGKYNFIYENIIRLL